MAFNFFKKSSTPVETVKKESDEGALEFEDLDKVKATGRTLNQDEINEMLADAYSDSKSQEEKGYEK